MRRVPDAMLMLGAAVLWYELLYTVWVGPFATYFEAMGVAYLLFGVALLWKTVLGIGWLVNRLRATP